MILHIIMAFNAFLKCSGQPKFDDHEPEVFAKQFERFLLTGDEEKVFSFENVSWYHVGDYDDESMQLTSLKEPLRILDCNKVLDERKIRSQLIDAARKRESKEGDNNVAN